MFADGWSFALSALWMGANHYYLVERETEESHQMFLSRIVFLAEAVLLVHGKDFDIHEKCG